MSIYSNYLSANLLGNFTALTEERKRQLNRISFIRQRPVIVYASDLAKQCPNMLDYSDILPFTDQLTNIAGDKIDIILETPGGLAATVEDLVRLIRGRFEHVGVIIPGAAMSAGTIFTMAADEILMGETSSLGPIDAQIITKGKQFSADAFLEGLKKIRDEANQNNRLDIALIPILQAISPGEIQHCENAQCFSRTLVTNWLKTYKFKYWKTHSSTGNPVTDEDKEERANSIASTLCNHNKWLTHGRSIKIQDLRDLRLQVTDYRENPDLNDAIMRYYTLLRMSFEANIYKIYETVASQVYRTLGGLPKPMPVDKLPDHGYVGINCPNCSNLLKLHYDFIGQAPTPIEAGALKFPEDNKINCPKCGTELNLLQIRLNFETQKQKKLV